MCARQRTSLTLMSLSSSGAERRSMPSSMLFIARRAFTRTCLVPCLTRLTFVNSENTIVAIIIRTNIMHAMATPSDPYALLTRGFADGPRMHNRGLGIDCLPHFRWQSAVEVLLQQCTLAGDAKWYLKRLLRTSLLGQWG